jgi:hypothetical protein
MRIQLTDNGDGSAKVTITEETQECNEDHRFSVVADGDTATVSYEETHSWLGQMRVSQPSADVYEALMQSDEVTQWLDEYNVDHIRRP